MQFPQYKTIVRRYNPDGSYTVEIHMTQYYLFRGDILIGKTDESTSLGTGNLHDLGQAGDVLVCIERDRVSRFAWQLGREISGGRYQNWVPIITSTKTEAKFRTLILLQG